MTDDHLDELASAYLDGTASAEEAGQVATDPALRARVEELQVVRDAVAALPPIDVARRDAALRAALAAFAEEGAAEPSLAPVTSLAAVAARRRRMPARYLRLVGAAAAVVLLAALVPLLGKLADSNDDADMATSDAFDETGSSIAGGDGGGEAAPEAAGDSAAGATTTVAQALADLGAFASLADLVTAVEDRVEHDGTDASAFGALDTNPPGCPPETASEAAPGPARSTAVSSATVAGDPVLAVLVTDAAGARTLQVFLVDGCEQLLEEAL